MAIVDLHVHSKYSEHPSEWFLQRLGIGESYTDPEFIYKEAREKGMTFVTITDHNTIEGSLLLKQKHPEEVITGVEVTSYFPEDGCKAHILVYGLDELEFRLIDNLRPDIYALRDFIREKNLAYSVAHATYSINKKLSIKHLEKLILLFDVFEGINGSRDAINNNSWMNILGSLTPSYIEDIYRRHRIEPISADPWVKGITGGSDDHAGIFIGKAFTMGEALTPKDFVNLLKNKKTTAAGSHNDFKNLAFAIYKIIYDFSKTKSAGLANSFLNSVTEYIFEKKPMGLKDELKAKKIKYSRKKDANSAKNRIVELIDSLKKSGPVTTEEKLDIVYNNISSIADELLKTTFKSLEKDLKSGNLFNLVGSISSSIPGIFLSVPFFSTLKHLYDGKELVKKFASNFEPVSGSKQKRILWFTDTLSDMNGVSSTLQTIGWLAHFDKKEIKIAASLPESQDMNELPPNIINIKSVYDMKLPYYEKYALNFPSILGSLNEISAFEPDEIYISTPGPVGLLGLLMARLFNVKCTGIYHTDFTAQASHIIKQDSASDIVESYTKWFYSMLDEIQVPTTSYIKELASRGFDESKMRIFRRGVDSRLFYPRKGARVFIRELFSAPEGFNLVYTGRMSEEKNLDFMLEVFREVSKIVSNVNLLMVGDGPCMEKLRKKTSDMENVFFSGKLKNQSLPVVYSGSDLMVFTSNTDTFGMSVLEAQSCGLPAVVSDAGGPKEIIVDGRTGYAARANDLKDWTDKICLAIEKSRNNPAEYSEMRTAARYNTRKNFNWELILNDITGNENGVIENFETVEDYSKQYFFENISI